MSFPYHKFLDFCYADEEKTHKYQLQLHCTKAECKNVDIQPQMLSSPVTSREEDESFSFWNYHFAKFHANRENPAEFFEAVESIYDGSGSFEMASTKWEGYCPGIEWVKKKKKKLAKTDDQALSAWELEYETAFSDINSWVEWYVCNPELSEKYFPLLTNKLKKRIRKHPPHFTANIIQRLPEDFARSIAQIEKLYGTTKLKRIQQHIDLIKLVSDQESFSSEIEKMAIESVKDELTEQLEYWIRVKKGLQTDKYLSSESEINTFDDLFIDMDLIEPCIQILRDVDPPLIGEKYNFIGRRNSKSALCIWMEELYMKDLIGYANDEHKAKLLNQKFSGLEMTKDGSLFRKTSKTNEEKYKDQIKVLISRVSQNSQTGK
ncbi:MAG: hypothetical protein WBA23_06150 [Tunicatimonas sp.]|uniref:hypothetical protein n=1 Tax=Tunicatimonas sp. TaxID=1940096 RepID=UPI003C7721B5